MAEFVTELGCHVTVRKAPEYLPLGLMLTLAIPEQGQRAEVFLSPENVRTLIGNLRNAPPETP